MSEFLVWRDFKESDVAELEGLLTGQRRSYLNSHLTIPEAFSLEPRRSLYIDFCVRNLAFAINSGMHGGKVSTATSLLGDTLQWACGLIGDSEDQQGKDPDSSRSHASEAPDIASESPKPPTDDTESPPKEITNEKSSENEKEATENEIFDPVSTPPDSGKAEDTAEETGTEPTEHEAANATRSEVSEKSRPSTTATLTTVASTHRSLMAEENRELLPNLESTLQYFDSLLLKHAVERPPFSVGVYSLADVKAITDHAVSTLFNNFELYRVAFVPEKCATAQPTEDDAPSQNEQNIGEENAGGEAGDETHEDNETPRSEQEANAATDGSATDEKSSELAKEMEKLRREFAISMEQQNEMLEKKLAILGEKFK